MWMSRILQFVIMTCVSTMMWSFDVLEKMLVFMLIYVYLAYLISFEWISQCLYVETFLAAWFKSFAITICIFSRSGCFYFVDCCSVRCCSSIIALSSFFVRTELSISQCQVMWLFFTHLQSHTYCNVIIMKDWKRIWAFQLKYQLYNHVEIWFNPTLLTIT